MSGWNDLNRLAAASVGIVVAIGLAAPASALAPLGSGFSYQAQFKDAGAAE